jgi:ribosome modulation factor
MRVKGGWADRLHNEAMTRQGTNLFASYRRSVLLAGLASYAILLRAFLPLPVLAGGGTLMDFICSSTGPVQVMSADPSNRRGGGADMSTAAHCAAHLSAGACPLRPPSAAARRRNRQALRRAVRGYASGFSGASSSSCEMIRQAAPSRSSY